MSVRSEHEALDSERTEYNRVQSAFVAGAGASSRRVRCLGVALTSMLALLAAHAYTQETAPAKAVPASKGGTETLLAEIDPGSVVSFPFEEGTRRYFVSPDRQRVAYVLKRNQRVVVVVNGEEQGGYDEVAVGIRFTADSSVMAFAARVGSKWHMVVGRVPGKAYDRIGETIVGAVGARLAYAAQEGALWRVVTEGREGKAYGTIAQLVASADATRIAYVGNDGKRSCVVVDDEERGCHDSVSQLQLPPQHWAYRFVDKDPADATGVRHGMVVDGHTYPSYTGVRFSPTGSAWVLKDAARNIWRLVAGGKDTALPGPILGTEFSPDGTHLAHWGFAGERRISVFLDGVELDPPMASEQLRESLLDRIGKALAALRLKTELLLKEELAGVAGQSARSTDWIREESDDGLLIRVSDLSVPRLSFSPDGTEVAYSILVEDKRMAVIRKGKAIGSSHPRIGKIAYSPDGKRVAYQTGNTVFGHFDTSSVYVDDVQQTGGKLGRPEQVVHMVFSPDSKRFATSGTYGKGLAAWVDGQRGPTFAWASKPQFSPDGHHVAYLGWDGKRACVVMDGSCTTQFDRVILIEDDAVNWEEAGGYSFLAEKGLPGKRIAVYRVQRPF